MLRLEKSKVCLLENECLKLGIILFLYDCEEGFFRLEKGDPWMGKQESTERKKDATKFMNTGIQRLG